MLLNTPFCCVYTLKCSDNTYYTGCTRDIVKRLARHQGGRVRSTRYRLPVEVVSCTAFRGRYKAYFFEKHLKEGSGRAFMKKILPGLP